MSFFVFLCLVKLSFSFLGFLRFFVEFWRLPHFAGLINFELLFEYVELSIFFNETLKNRVYAMSRFRDNLLKGSLRSLRFRWKFKNEDSAGFLQDSSAGAWNVGKGSF